MSFLEKAVYSLVNGRQTITSPIFVKEFERNNRQLLDLIELSKKITSSKRDYIERDIAFLKRGIEGEQNVYFELKNSFIPMLCLHDIRLEHKDYVAQLDFVVITNKFIYVLETKKLNGDIEINPDGDFIRTIRTSEGRFIKKEGMYSPFSQNQRHVNILREMLTDNGLIKTMPVKSAVVIANPKTIVKKNNAPKEIHYNIYKYDQVATLLKREMNNPKNDKNLLEKHLYAIADFLVQNNRPLTFDYLSKYGLTEDDYRERENKAENKEVVGVKEEKETRYAEGKNDSRIMELLKAYRLKTSREEGVKPYFIFNNAEMEELIRINPSTKTELLQVKGFGQKKIEKYGDGILEILSQN